MANIAGMTITFRGWSTHVGNLTVASNTARRSTSFGFPYGTTGTEVDRIAHGRMDFTAIGVPQTLNLNDFTDVFNATSQSFGTLSLIGLMNVGDEGTIIVEAGGVVELPWSDGGTDVFYAGDVLFLGGPTILWRASPAPTDRIMSVELSAGASGVFEYYFAGQ